MAGLTPGRQREGAQVFQGTAPKLDRFGIGHNRSIQSVVCPAKSPSSVLKSFRVRPDDSHREVYSASHDEVDNAALELCKELGIELPPESVLRQWPTPLQTVRDVVLWLNWVRTQTLPNWNQHSPPGV